MTRCILTPRSTLASGGLCPGIKPQSGKLTTKQHARGQNGHKHYKVTRGPMHELLARVGLHSPIPLLHPPWPGFLYLPPHPPSQFPSFMDSPNDRPTEGGLSDGAMAGPPNQSHRTSLGWPGTSACHSVVVQKVVLMVLLFSSSVDLHITFSLL